MVSVLLLITAFASSACNVEQKQSGIPSSVQTAIDAVTMDIAAQRDEKIYHEAAEEWRAKSTLEESQGFFHTLRVKLGGVKSRTFHTARGQQNTGGNPPGQSLTIQYQTTFERGEGMETFTLIERDGRWLLAGYFVNSDALK